MDLHFLMASSFRSPLAQGLLGIFASFLISCSPVEDSASTDGYGPDTQRTTGSLGFASYGAGTSGRNYAQRGTDQFFNPSAFAPTGPGKAVVVKADGENVQLSLVNATIQSAAKAVLGDALKLNYVVANGLDGRITLQTTAPVPKDTLFELFSTALAANGAQIVKDGSVGDLVCDHGSAPEFRIGFGDGQDPAATH
jgi:hypothetical protein